jgi:hypothetical protein
MSDHLIPVTPDQLARLPDGVRVIAGVTAYRTDRTPDGRLRLLAAHGTSTTDRGDLCLDLSDTPTRAAVAAVFVVHTMGPHDSVRDPIGHSACCAAVWWPTRFDWRLTPDEITHHVARLARAALDALTPPEPPPPPPR